jgi:hypothetical protein
MSERQRIARYNRERYANDPDFRLRCINRGRVHQGLAPRKSLDEVRSRS